MIGIMCAMVEELEPILEYMHIKQRKHHVNNTFYLAEFEGEDIVLAYSKIGKVNAAITATIMIEKFGVKKLLFSGVAGAVDNDLKIGDLITAKYVCQHDVDLTVFGYKHGFIPESEIYFECDGRLIDTAFKVADKLKIKLKKGIIASGDQFVHSKAKKEWIQEVFGASAIEMEGGAVGCVCWNEKVPFFMLRAISDTAEEGAGVDFDAFLEESSRVSAKFLIEMLREIKVSNEK
jgi:adenosylhomocysteine/aminodeoxyfutalosine nucleosidase